MRARRWMRSFPRYSPFFVLANVRWNPPLQSAANSRTDWQAAFLPRLSLKRGAAKRRKNSKPPRASFGSAASILTWTPQSLRVFFEESRKASEELAEAQRALALAADDADAARQELRRTEARIAALEEINKSIREKNEISAWVSSHAALVRYGIRSSFVAGQGASRAGAACRDAARRRPFVACCSRRSMRGSFRAGGVFLRRERFGEHPVSESARRASERPQGRLLENITYPDSIGSLMEELFGGLCGGGLAR